jgi:uncharacterized membrane protein YkoI
MRFGYLPALVAGLMVVGCSHMHHEKEDGEEGNEVKMTIDQVPPAVRAALQREAQGGTIKTVDKEEDHGKTVYETDVMINGKNWEIKVDGEGKVVGKKVDNEEGEERGEKK